MDLLNTDEFTTDFYQRIDLRGYVIFIENNSQAEVVKYITSNYSIIQQVFKAEGKRFILLSGIVNRTDVLKLFKYRYPRLGKDDVWEGFNFETIKRYLGYKGNIETGLLCIDTVFKSKFIEFESNSVNDFKKLAGDYLNDYKKKLLRLVLLEDVLPPSLDFHSDDGINLDTDTEQAVKKILEQLETLKDKGNLLQILPIIEKYLKGQNTTHLDKLSSLSVDERFTLFLRDYNLEIKISHLTKSIYLLFLNHPEGILLTELHSHRKELFEYYKLVSNRLDYDKMNESIDDIIDISTNAIYVHLSRIKSAFTKVLHQSIAKNYYIDGGKSKPKKIDLKSKLIIWHNTVGRTTVIPQQNEEPKDINNVSNIDVSMRIDDEDSFFDD